MQEDSPQRSDLNSKENTRNQKKSVTKINGNSGNEVHKGSSASVNHINEAGNELVGKFYKSLKDTKLHYRLWGPGDVSSRRTYIKRPASMTWKESSTKT